MNTANRGYPMMGWKTDPWPLALQAFFKRAHLQATMFTTVAFNNNSIDQRKTWGSLGKKPFRLSTHHDEIKRNIFLLGESGQYDFVINRNRWFFGDIEITSFVGGGEAGPQVRWDLGAISRWSIPLRWSHTESSKELKTNRLTPLSKRIIIRLEFNLPSGCRTDCRFQVRSGKN